MLFIQIRFDPSLEGCGWPCFSFLAVSTQVPFNMLENIAATDKEAIKEKIKNNTTFDIILLITATAGAAIKNALSREASPSTTAALDGIMDELTRGNNNTIGLLGPDSRQNANISEKVERRAKHEGLFDVVVMATVSNKPNYRRIQDEIAKGLGLRFDDNENNGVGRRSRRMRIAKVLCLRSDDSGGNENGEVESRGRRIRRSILLKDKILVILRDLCDDLDLNKIGIPNAADHIGCRLLLTSATEHVLSNQMRAQRIFII